MQAQPEGSPTRPAAAGVPRLGSRAPGRRITHPLPDPVAIRLGPIPDAAPPYDDGPVGARMPGAGGDIRASGMRAGGAPGPQRAAGAAGRVRADAFAAAIVAALERGAAAGQGAAGEHEPAGEHGATREHGATGQHGAAEVHGAAEEHGAADAGAPEEDGGPTGNDGWAGAGQPAEVDWPSRFAQVLAETLAGSRPAGQIAPWTTERVRSHIRRLGPHLTLGQRPVIRRIVTSRPASGVIEMSVVVGFGSTVRALAVRLEREQAHRPAPWRAGRQARWLCTAVEAA